MEINAGQHGKTGKKYTFDEFFSTADLPHTETHKRSWNIDACLATNHITPFFGARRFDGISTADVESWLASLRVKGLAPTTCNRILAVLKNTFSWAETSGHIPPAMSPCRIIRLSKVASRKERFLSETDGQKLVKHLRQNDNLQPKAIQLPITHELVFKAKTDVIEAVTIKK